jgi:hypothetical protein
MVYEPIHLYKLIFKDSLAKNTILGVVRFAKPLLEMETFLETDKTLVISKNK